MLNSHAVEVGLQIRILSLDVNVSFVYLLKLLLESLDIILVESTQLFVPVALGER